MRAASLVGLTLFSTLPSFSQLAANRYTLILDDQPVAERFVGRDGVRSSAAVAYRGQIEAKQQNLRTALASRRIQVTGSVSTLLNAIFVSAAGDQVASLASLPGVTAVVPQRIYKRKLNRVGALVDLAPAWTAVGGSQNAGKGIKIGIIDSGIDITHPALQDSSLTAPSGFPKCGTPSDCTNFTNSKVIVARSYVSTLAAPSNSANPAADDRPDDYSARDRDGHGTAVAVAAAGNAVTSANNINFSGIAPKAFLGNYKVFGSPGVNDFAYDPAVSQALDAALSDGMDIVSYSSGTPAICPVPIQKTCDPVGYQFELAAQSGMVIIVQAGDDGDSGYNYPAANTIESPSYAPSVIAVGATTNAHYFNFSISVPGGASNLQNIVTDSGDSPIYLQKSAITAGILDVTVLGDNGLACSPIGNFAPYGLYGAVALVKRGTCDFVIKVTNAMNAGAVAVIIYMADSSSLVSPTGLSNLVPTFMVSNADGLSLKSYAAANLYGPVTIDSAGSEQDDTVDQNLLAGYSSVGPTIGNYSVKPDIVAVGGDPTFGNYIYTAAQSYDPLGSLYSSTGYAVVGGTSFATPLVAGAAALVKQHNPALTGPQIKSALVNTATQDVLTDDSDPASGGSNSPIPADVQSYGGGKLDVGAALSATVAVSPVSLSFGIVTTLPQTQTLTVTNTATGPVTLTISYQQVPGEPSSASLTFDHPTLSLAGKASGTVNVTLAGTLPPSQEYSAFVAIKGSGVSLTVPVVYYIPNGLACNFCNLFPLYGGFGFDGVVGKVFTHAIAVKLTDDWGVPIAGASVTYSASGGGSLLNSDSVTNAYGIAYTDAKLGPTPGDTIYTVTAAGMSLTFDGLARVQPAISSSSIVNSASFSTTQPIAPGSYISIGNGSAPGTGLSDFTAFSTTARLPLAMEQILPDGLSSNVIVTFDSVPAGISVPAHLTYVSPTQINVQVPWELQGSTSAQIKVAVGYYSNSNVITVPISNYSPAFFEVGTGVVAARDSNAAVVNASNPAQRGSAVALYVNGLGPVSNQPASGEPASLTVLGRTPVLPVVMIGDQQAAVSFSGLTPGLAGLYQVNVTIPSNLTPGNQPITIAIGGQTSPTSGIVVK